MQQNPALPDPTSPVKRQFLTFMLGAHEFGIDLKWLQELQLLHDLGTITENGEIRSNIARLRGEIIPMIDIRASFPPRPPVVPGQVTQVVVLRTSSRLAGMIVDKVTGTVVVSEGDISLHENNNGVRNPMRGLCRVNGRRIILVDVSVLLQLDVTGDSAASPSAAGNTSLLDLATRYPRMFRPILPEQGHAPEQVPLPCHPSADGRGPALDSSARRPFARFMKALRRR